MRTTKPIVVHEGFSFNRLLANILRISIEDYKYPSRKAKVIEFFNSDWGAEICEQLGTTAGAVLNRLKGVK
jgi:hypothetical protein